MIGINHTHTILHTILHKTILLLHIHTHTHTHKHTNTHTNTNTDTLTQSHFRYPNVTIQCADDIQIMHPTSNTTFALVTAFLTEMADIFPDEQLHLGMDEVQWNCFNRSAEVCNGIERLERARERARARTRRESVLVSQPSGCRSLIGVGHDAGPMYNTSTPRLPSSCFIIVLSFIVFSHIFFLSHRLPGPGIHPRPRPGPG